MCYLERGLEQHTLICYMVFLKSNVDYRSIRLTYRHYVKCSVTFIVHTALWSRWRYSHFTDEEADSEEWSDSLKVTHFRSNRTRVRSRSVRVQHWSSFLWNEYFWNGYFESEAARFQQVWSKKAARRLDSLRQRLEKWMGFGSQGLKWTASLPCVVQLSYPGKSLHLVLGTRAVQKKLEAMVLVLDNEVVDKWQTHKTL